MKRRTKALAAAGAGLAIVATAGIAIGTGADDSEAPITGTDLDRASAAALAATGGGRVTDSEVGDEEGYYEIEVTLEDGRQVDVHLDKNFNVLSQEAEGSGDGTADD